MLRDIQDIDPFVSALSEGRLEIARSMLESGYCLKPELSVQGLQHSSLDIVQKYSKAKKKIPFYNLLLLAGAGLDIKNIPEGILRKYNPSNKPMGPFLLLGIKQSADMVKPKLVVISSLESLQICLENPDVKINTKQLALAILSFENENLEHIELIKALLPENELAEASDLYFKIQQREKECDLKQLALNSIRKDELERIKQLPRDDWKKEYVVSKVRLDGMSEAAQQLLLAILFKLKRSDKTIRLSNLANRLVMTVLNAVVEHLHLARTTKSNFRAQIFYDCREVIDRTYSDMLLISNNLEDLQCFDENAINMQVFESFIKDMFSHFRIILRERHVNELNSFIDARVGSLLYVARAYIKQGKIDVALTLANKAMRENTSLKVNNEGLEVTRKHNEARAKKVFVDIYLLQGWNQKAAHLFLDVIDCYTPSAMLDNGLVETARNLLKKEIGARLQLKVLNALKQYDDVIKHDPLIKMQLRKYALLKGLMAEIVSPMMNDVNVTIFKLDASLVSRKLGRHGDIVVNPGDFSLVLTVLNFKSLQETIELAVSEKYSFLKVSIPNKTFTLHLKNITKDQIKTCLNEVESLLRPPVEIVEPVVAHAADMPVELSKRLSKLSIHQAPIVVVDDNKMWGETSDELSKMLRRVLPVQSSEPSHPPKIGGKIKTRGVPGAEYLESECEDEIPVLEPSYGFEPMKGYSSIIPIESGYLPHNTLFLTILEDERFLPFKKLYDSGVIRSIASKGHNEQGVKLSTITDGNEKIPVARLKICGNEGKGALRASGGVIQVIETEDGLKKLYAINDVRSKKQEARSR